MASFKRAIALTLSLTIIIIFSAVLEYFCTPYSEWFLLLKLPKIFVNDILHNVTFFFFYILSAWVLSGIILYGSGIEKGVFSGWVVAMILATYFLFGLKSIEWSLAATSIGTILSIVGSFINKKSQIASALVACICIYLLGMEVMLLLLNVVGV